MKDIIVIGEVCEDIIMHDPGAVEVMGAKIWARDIVSTIGGSASIAATAFAHLGEKVKLYSSIGDDSQGKMLYEMIEKFGTDLRFLRVLKGKRTTRSMIISQGAEKNFLGCSPMLPIEIPDISSLDNTKLIHIAGFMLYPELWTDEAFLYYEEAKRRGIPIAVDGQRPHNDEINPFELAPLERMIGLSDVYFAAQKEVKQFTDSTDVNEIGKMLINMGAKNVVLKQGAEGCVVFGQNGEIHKIDSYKVDVYDSIGSGDLFGASFAYGMINSFTIKDCARFASVFTALSLLEYEEYKKYPEKEAVMKIVGL
ncbi:MAG: carbohydrate kinase family protein [Clostridiaceae bacterium]|jgi:sugar/nucleoside kinase (ribokinase family)|nr:carbohydrate kinase family protein [Clostridiaceae bacterium]